MDYRLVSEGPGLSRVFVEDDNGTLVEKSRIMPTDKALDLRNAARSQRVARLADVGKEEPAAPVDPMPKPKPAPPPPKRKRASKRK